LDEIPNEPAKEDQQQRDYFYDKRRTLLVDYLEYEMTNKLRVVLENEA